LYPVGTRREFSKGPGFCLSPKEVWIVSKKVGIIGAGVVGTAIGVVLHDKGYEITGVHDKKSESTKTLVDRIGCTTYASPQEVSRSTDILFITTNDSAIPDVVDELAQSRAFDYGQVLIHMSGAQTSAIFDKARALGAWGLSLHPLQSFASPDMAIENIPGSIFSIEGDQEAYEIAIDIVVVSIFVNPTQFGVGEDFEVYPRDFQRDSSLLEREQVDAIFAPTAGEMYLPDFSSWVEVTGEITAKLCGASRPGHFRGVTTVCTKLFNICLPDLAFFGQKDAQQAMVLEKMVRDLNFPLQIIRVPIVREADGLAMSSRNVYLDAEDRKQALVLNQALEQAEKAIRDGERDAGNARVFVSAQLL
jgi:predicted CoA-binding protein